MIYTLFITSDGEIMASVDGNLGIHALRMIVTHVEE
jgi:hypothetical protein